MPGIPLELRLGLREGSLFYFQNRAHTSAEPHFHFVVCADPLGVQVLIFTVVTSKIERVKRDRRDCLETVVELGPAELPGILTKPSIVDCNDVTREPLAEFCARWERGEIKAFGADLPPPLRSALRAAPSMRASSSRRTSRHSTNSWKNGTRSASANAASRPLPRPLPANPRNNFPPWRCRTAPWL